MLGRHNKNKKQRGRYEPEQGYLPFKWREGAQTGLLRPKDGDNVDGTERVLPLRAETLSQEEEDREGESQRRERKEENGQKTEDGKSCSSRASESPLGALL